MNNPPESAADISSAVVEMNAVAVGASHQTETPSVEDVTWTIRPGDYWVVGGSPGSGKSDLLATIAGLLRPLRGTLRLFGLNRNACAEAELNAVRFKTGLVFENGGRPFHDLTVAENVALPLCYHENRVMSDLRTRVAELLEFGGLGSVANNMSGRISHFLRQRLGLIRALALRPELLLVDNPLSGFAPPEATWWRDTLERLVAGHPVMAGKPVTLVIGCLDLRPWMDQGRRFALLKDRRWFNIGDREALSRSKKLLLREPPEVAAED